MQSWAHEWLNISRPGDYNIIRKSWHNTEPNLLDGLSNLPDTEEMLKIITLHAYFGQFWGVWMLIDFLGGIGVTLLFL